MKILTLVRGLPGSGKTTFAKTLGHRYVEADDFFMKDGGYKFDPAQLKNAHAWCQAKAEEWMKMGSHVTVSNTFTREWEMSAYYELAEKYGYTVFSVVVENRHGGKNVHGVPLDKLKEMQDRFEIKL